MVESPNGKSDNLCYPMGGIFEGGDELHSLQIIRHSIPDFYIVQPLSGIAEEMNEIPPRRESPKRCLEHQSLAGFIEYFNGRKSNVI